MMGRNNVTDFEMVMWLNAINKVEKYIDQKADNLNTLLQANLPTLIEKLTPVGSSLKQALIHYVKFMQMWRDLSDQRANNHKLQANANQFNHPHDTERVIYGFINGAVDVFPYNSLPQLCRGNSTETEKGIEDLFIKERYELPRENLEAVTALSVLLQKPYGISFSCLFGIK